MIMNSSEKRFFFSEVTVFIMNVDRTYCHFCSSLSNLNTDGTADLYSLLALDNPLFQCSALTETNI